MTEELRWMEVGTFGAVYEAEIAMAALESAGIPAVLGSGAHAGLFGAGWQGFAPGGVAVLVPSDRVEEARELLQDDPPEV
jgi:hypothetical protein